jgi:hypothetical protein
MEVIGTFRVFRIRPSSFLPGASLPDAIIRACQIGGIDDTKCFGDRRPDLAVVDSAIDPAPHVPPTGMGEGVKQADR